jgi:hypothetical protein
VTTLLDQEASAICTDGGSSRRVAATSRVGEIRIHPCFWHHGAVLKAPSPDPMLDPFRQGIAVLRRNGELAGYVATMVGTFWSPSHPLSRQWWIWLTVVWANGDHEPPFEDYPPWTSVREIHSGTFTWDEGDARRGEYTAEWLTEGEREAAWAALGLTPGDF